MGYLCNRFDSMLKLTTILITLLTAVYVMGDNLYYRYKNAEGVQVIDFQVPPEFINNGYEVITQSGDVIEEVPPFNPNASLSPDELKSIEQQRRTDMLMLRSYSTLNDLYFSRDRKIESLEREIAIIENSLTSQQDKLADQRKYAADLQRSGQDVAESLQKNIEQLVSEIADTDKVLAIRKEELNKTRENYERQVARFRVLKGLDVEQ